MISPEREDIVALSGKVNIAACGGKAVGLAQARAFAAVPDFVVIPESWFRKAASTQLELVSADWSGWDSASARSSGAARLLATVELTTEMRETLSGALREHLFGATRLAVRSSALDEDGLHASRAGLYTSVSNVAPYALNRAVIECWKSWFSTQAQVHRSHAEWRPPQMAVVIQRMVDAHCAGVAAVYRDTVEVESVAGLAARLVDGTAEPDHHCFSLPLESSRLPHEHAARVASHLRQQLGGGDLEIEWAWDGKQIHVIQARSLTVAPPAPPAPRFPVGRSQQPVLRVSPLYGETPPEREFPLGQLDDVIDHYRRKRCRLYAVATDYGCSLGAALVVRFNHRGTVGDGWVRVEHQLGETALLDISPSERQRIIPTPKLGVAMRDLCGDDPSALVTVVVREFITGRGGALSGVLADGGVRIEYSHAGLFAINRGLADTDELTVYEGRLAEPQLIPTGWTSQMLSTIADVTRLFTARCGPAVVEWSLHGDLATPVDYSRTGAAEDVAAKGAVISEGTCEGPALLMDPAGIGDLVKASEEPIVSVGQPLPLPTEGYVSQLVQRISTYSQPPVVIAERPYAIFATLIPHVAGFVFYRGAARFCHLAILLREYRVPAVSTPIISLPFNGDIVCLRSNGYISIGGKS
ncbi:MAG: PEP/pyruvate-binding domain-containing protein [Pseudonocardiaceae bacterium]